MLHVLEYLEINMHCIEKHTVIYQRPTLTEQTEAPWAGENMSPFNLLQTKDSNVHVLLLMPCSQAIRHPKKKLEKKGQVMWK